MAAIAVHTGRLFQPFHLGVPGNPPSQRHVSVDVEPDPVIPEFVVLPPERERRIHDEHRIHRRMDALVPVVLPGQWVMRTTRRCRSRPGPPGAAAIPVRMRSRERCGNSLRR